MGIALSLFEPRYDFPVYRGAPSGQVMIAAIPRSGSTMFCIDLWESGVAGAPLEYLNFRLLRSSLRWHDAVGSPVEYWNHIQQVRTSPNGVFAYKMFPSVYQQVAKSSKELLSRVAPTHVIYLTRVDLDAQAISYSKAIRSVSWFADAAPLKPAEYSYDHIVESKNLLCRQMQEWEYVFNLTGTRVHRVTYEEILANREESIAEVVRYITGSTYMRKISIPKVTVQRDQVSRVWMDQFTIESKRLENKDPAKGEIWSGVAMTTIGMNANYVKDTGTNKGRGVFAGRTFMQGERVETAPVVAFEDCPLPKILSDRIYQWTDSSNQHNMRAIALGHGSLYNHDDIANLRYVVDPLASAIHYFALRDIVEGEELSINYHFSGGRAPDGQPSLTENNWLEIHRAVRVRATR